MTDIHELYSSRTLSVKRGIIMEMLDVLMNSGSHNPEIWKLHIDDALDKLEENVYLPLLCKDK